ADAAKAANPSFAATWLPVEQADVALDNFWSSVWHLHAVADTPELRAAHAAGQAVLTERGIAAQQDRAMFDTLRSLAVGIITLTCTGNSTAALTGVPIRDSLTEGQ
ncbi:hypothetical protein LTR94_036605, partial [Friedmanniomyces endolithicus]